MSRSVVQCRKCGYMTSGTEIECPRCRASLADAEIIATGTPKPAPDEGPVFYTHESVSGLHSNEASHASPPAPPTYAPFAPTTRPGIPPQHAAQAPYYAPPQKRTRSVNMLGVAVILLIIGAIGATIAVVVLNIARKRAATEAARSELRALIAHQPDFTAQAHGKAGPAELSGTMVQHGDRLFMSTLMPESFLYGSSAYRGFASANFIVEKAGQITVLFPKGQHYKTTQNDEGKGTWLTLREEFNAVANVSDVEIERLADDVVSGYEVRAYKVVDPKNRSNAMFVWIAPALENLVVKCALNWTEGQTEELRFTLSEVSLEPDVKVFTIPDTYTELSERPAPTNKPLGVAPVGKD